MTTPRWRPRARTWEAAVTAAFTTLVAWPWLSLTQYVTVFDTVTYGGPNLAFTFAEWRAGHLPAWNPTAFGGATHLGNPPAAALYPVKALFVGVDPARALDLITAAHLYLLAAGMFVLLASRLRLRPPAAFAGTAVMVGSGLIMVRSLQSEQIAVIAWVPWILATADWAIARAGTGARGVTGEKAGDDTGEQSGGRTDGDPESPARRAMRYLTRTGPAISATAVTVALLVIAGHPQQVYMALPMIGAWTVVRAVEHTRAAGARWTHFGRRLVAPVIGGLLGAGVAAAQLMVIVAQVPLAATAGQRTLATPSAPDYVLAPRLIGAALAGNALRTKQVGTGGALEAATFVGISALALALVGLGVVVTRRRARLTGALFAVVTVAGLVAALGPQCTYEGGEQRGCALSGAAYRLAFKAVPGFDQARVPARWSLLVVLGVAVLAAMAADALVRREVTRRALAIAAGLGALAVAVLGTTRSDLTPADVADDASRTLGVWLVLAGAVALAIGLAWWVPRRGEPHRGDHRSGRRRAVGLALVAPVALIGLELSVATLHSPARAELSDQPFTALGGPITRYLADQPDRMLALPAATFDADYLARALRPNSNETVGVRNLDGYDGGVQVTKPWVAAMTPFTKAGFNLDLPLSYQTELPASPSYLARFGVRYVVIDAVAIAGVLGLDDPSSAAARARAADTVVPGWRGPVVTDASLELWENPAWRGEARIMHRTEVVPGAPAVGTPSASAPVGDWLATWSQALPSVADDTALVAPGGPALTCDTDCDPDPVTVARPRPGEVTATVTLDRAALMVVPEQHAPGWTATVDGTGTPIVATDAMSQGVMVPAGTHTVALTYRPPGWRLGLVVSLVSLAVVAALALWPVIRRRRSAG